MPEKKVKSQKLKVKSVTKTAKPVAKKLSAAKSASGGKTGLSVSVLDVAGKAAGTMILPESLFGAKVNKSLIAQAVRVYLANQRRGTADTKTRGEVTGSTRKIYRQKGTGRARHGGIRAPIFVKGGIAHGPKPKDYSLDFPVKMKRRALFSALSAKLEAEEIVVVSGFEKNSKTKDMVKSFTAVGMGKKDKVLFVTPEVNVGAFKAVRNIAGFSVLPANQLNTYAVLLPKKLVVMKEAISVMEKVFGEK